jgi:hypothetical protein
LPAAPPLWKWFESKQKIRLRWCGWSKKKPARKREAAFAAAGGWVSGGKLLFLPKIRAPK